MTNTAQPVTTILNLLQYQCPLM